MDEDDMPPLMDPDRLQEDGIPRLECPCGHQKGMPLPRGLAVSRQAMARFPFPRHDGHVFETAKILKKRLHDREIPHILEHIIDDGEYWPYWKIQDTVPRSKHRQNIHGNRRWFALRCGTRHLKIGVHFQYASQPKLPGREVSREHRDICVQLDNPLYVETAVMPNVTEFRYHLKCDREDADAVSTTIRTGCRPDGQKYTQTPWLAIYCTSPSSSKDVAISIAVHHSPCVDFDRMVVQHTTSQPDEHWTRLGNMLHWAKFCYAYGGAPRLWLTPRQWQLLVRSLSTSTYAALDTLGRADWPLWMQGLSIVPYGARLGNAPQWTHFAGWWITDSAAYFIVDDVEAEMKRIVRGSAVDVGSDCGFRADGP